MLRPCIYKIFPFVCLQTDSRIDNYFPLNFWSNASFSSRIQNCTDKYNTLISSTLPFLSGSLEKLLFICNILKFHIWVFFNPLFWLISHWALSIFSSGNCSSSISLISFFLPFFPMLYF